MVDINLKAALREKSGKGAARSARRNGLVPGVIYGGKQEPVMITLNGNELLTRLRAGKFMASLLSVEVDGGKESVLCRDVQRDLINGMPIHIDFMRVSKTQRVQVYVPVLFLNAEECVGIKKGGSLVEVRPEVELHVPVANIPDQIEVDLTKFDIGDVIHISDIKLPGDVEPVIEDRDFVIANISAPMGEEVEEEEKEEEEVEEAETAVKTEEGA